MKTAATRCWLLTSSQPGAWCSLDQGDVEPDRHREGLREAAREPGWTPLMRLMAIISLQLGIFNLFPIPILDGGMILMLLIEGLIRRDISMRVKERAYQVAFVFLMLFAAVVIYNDIMKSLPGLHQHLP